MASERIESIQGETSLNRQQDFLLVEEFEFDSFIGVFDWEKQVKQTLCLDLAAEYDFANAAVSDSIDDAVSYVDVCAAVKTVAGYKHHHLLEHLLENIANELLKQFPFRSLELKLSKPGAVSAAKNVAISMRRERV